MVKKQIDIHRKLIQQSISGNMKAQYQLYKLYADSMYFTCYNLMNSREEAEDMLQEAFSEAFKSLDVFRFESSFGTWLKRIVVNKCINELKRKKMDLKLFDNLDSIETSYIEVDDDLDEFNMEIVKMAIEKLPPGGKAVFQLYLLEGYDHKEIAEILGVSESNSKTQYMRAKNRIREILKNKSHGKR